jgi:hypothetical protein
MISNSNSEMDFHFELDQKREFWQKSRRSLQRFCTRKPKPRYLPWLFFRFLDGLVVPPVSLAFGCRFSRAGQIDPPKTKNQDEFRLAFGIMPHPSHGDRSHQNLPVTMAPSIKLVDIYSHRTKADKKQWELDLFAVYIKEETTKKPFGWLFSSHFVADKISPEEVLLYTRSILATHIANDSDLSLKVNQAIFSDGRAHVINLPFLRKVFPPLRDKTQTLTLQLVNENELQSLPLFIESPSLLVHMLAEESKTIGWLTKSYFHTLPESGLPTKKFTPLEIKLFHVQVLILTGYYASNLDLENKLDRLKYAWGSKFKNNHKPARDMKQVFSQYINSSNCIIKMSPSQPNGQPSVAESDWAAKIRWKNPMPCTPAATRGSHRQTERFGTPLVPTEDQISPKSIQATPVMQTSRVRRVMSTATKLASSVRKVFKKPRQTQTPRENGSEEDMESPSPIRRRRFQQELTNSLTETGQDYNDDDPSALPWEDSSFVSRREGEEEKTEIDETVPKPPTPRLLPFRATQSHQTTYREDDFDYLVDSHTAMDEKRALEVKMAMAKARSELETKESGKLLENALHLAAVGSPMIRRVMKALLINSMRNNRVTELLRSSGYADKRSKQTIVRKKKENDARQRRVAKRGVEPKLIEETVRFQFRQPLSNKRVRARCQRDWAVLCTTL